MEMLGLGPRGTLFEAEISGRRGRFHCHRGHLVAARATMLKPRDVFDISVVDAIDGDALIANLHEVAEKKDDLLRRLGDIKEDFVQAELAELDIRPRWEKHKKTCLETARGIVERIPKATA
jgi:hypothetical protein